MYCVVPIFLIAFFYSLSVFVSLRLVLLPGASIPPKSTMHNCILHSSPYLQKNHPYFITIFRFLLFSFNLRLLLNLGVFASPYFDHDAFVHHALGLHVQQDASIWLLHPVLCHSFCRIRFHCLCSSVTSLNLGPKCCLCPDKLCFLLTARVPIEFHSLKTITVTAFAGDSAV